MRGGGGGGFELKKDDRRHKKCWPLPVLYPLPMYDQEEEEHDAYSEMLRADQALKKLKHKV
jgi:hypothetical protein